MLKLKKDFFLQLRREDCWKKVMKKVAFRDCRKDALDIHKLSDKEKFELNLSKEKSDPDAEKRDPLLYNYITSPKINNGERKRMPFRVKRSGRTVINFKTREVDSYKISLDPKDNARPISASPVRT